MKIIAFPESDSFIAYNLDKEILKRVEIIKIDKDSIFKEVEIKMKILNETGIKEAGTQKIGFKGNKRGRNETPWLSHYTVLPGISWIDGILVKDKEKIFDPKFEFGHIEYYPF